MVEARRLADRSQEVGDDAEVRHLLARNLEDGGLPPTYLLELPVAHAAFVVVLLERRSREQVLAQNVVLDLGGLGKQFGELTTADDD